MIKLSHKTSDISRFLSTSANFGRCYTLGMKTTPLFWNIFAVIAPPLLGLGTVLSLLFVNDNGVSFVYLKRIYLILFFAFFSLLGIIILRNAEAIIASFSKLSQKTAQALSFVLALLSIGSGSLFMGSLIMINYAAPEIFFPSILFGSIGITLLLSMVLSWVILKIWNYFTKRKIIIRVEEKIS